MHLHCVAAEGWGGGEEGEGFKEEGVRRWLEGEGIARHNLNSCLCPKYFPNITKSGCHGSKAKSGRDEDSLPEQISGPLDCVRNKRLPVCEPHSL